MQTEDETTERINRYEALSDLACGMEVEDMPPDVAAAANRGLTRLMVAALVTENAPA